MIVGEDVEIFEHLFLMAGLWSSAATLKNGLEIPQKLNINLSYWPAIPILGIYPKELKICLHKNLYRNVQISTIHNWLKVETIKISTDKWVNKRWCIHSMEYNSAERKKGRVIHATTWMDLENIIPVKEVRHKCHILRDSSYMNVLSRQIHEDKK